LPTLETECDSDKEDEVISTKTHVSNDFDDEETKDSGEHEDGEVEKFCNLFQFRRRPTFPTISTNTNDEETKDSGEHEDGEVEKFCNLLSR
jgi:hypothetical protein